MSPEDVSTWTWPTKSVEEILRPHTLEAIKNFEVVQAGIIKPRTFRSHGSTGNGLRLTESRTLSEEQTERLRRSLLAPASYWIGHPKYRRFPPNPGFLFECFAKPYDLIIAVDLTNPGWKMLCNDEFYWGFHFANSKIRPIAKELFLEFASPSKTAMWKKGSLPKVEFRGAPPL